MCHSWKQWIRERFLALLNPDHIAVIPLSYGVDRTWKSGRISYLVTFKLAKFTYFSRIYRGSICHSWKWCTIQCSVALLNHSWRCCQFSSIWGRWQMKNWKNFPSMQCYTFFSRIYKGLVCHSWKMASYRTSSCVVKSQPVHIPVSPLPNGVDWTWKCGRVSYLGNVNMAELTYFSWIYVD